MCPVATRHAYRHDGGTVNRRIYFGIIATWFLLEGAKGLWRVWAAQRADQPGWLGCVANDVLEVTG
jgi:hypothetical protein